jgi:cellulose synthase/poly-beta-1,6-N-acetylglucosamine synthase-like glycosyltransferase
MLPSPPATLLDGAYLATLAALGLFGLHRVWLVTRFRWGPRAALPTVEQAEAPVVTVQLPLYNERTVAARLIRAVGALDWPRERLEIQVLDDSIDETRAIVEDEVGELVRRGLDAKVIRRASRAGFKAGALAHGLTLARGELVAIFDADFVPGADFLRRLVPAFADSGIGMVQARWGHMNRDESLLTRAQSTLLDGHFVIEHTVRFDHGLFFNFNGTAGIWRRAAIDSAGGWQHDTLTEDLDLSYRAQLCGWRFLYAPLYTVPAEVPAELGAFQSQQYRWAKGSVQVARKLAGRIARAELPFRIKLEAAAHLLGNAGYPFVLVLAALLPLVTTRGTSLGPGWNLAAFLVCTFSVIAFYERGQRAIGRPWWRRVLDVPAALALGIGMSVAQARAVLSGLLGQTGEFVRTPKRGDAPAATRYRLALARWPWLESVYSAWFALGIARAVAQRNWEALPFLALFFTGFAWVGGLALRESWRGRAPRRPLGSADEAAHVLAGEVTAG